MPHPIPPSADDPRQPGDARAVVVWVLIGAFLLQPILTYLVTPLVSHDAQGEQIVICTLQGEKVVTLDLSDGGGGIEHCPALELVQIASASPVSAPPEVPVMTFYAVQPNDQTVGIAHRRLHFCAYASRAPPLV